MPANKNAMTRYKILDELLSSRYHNYSLDDLTEEVSNRLADIDPYTNGVVRTEPVVRLPRDGSIEKTCYQTAGCAPDDCAPGEVC